MPKSEGTGMKDCKTIHSTSDTPKKATAREERRLWAALRDLVLAVEGHIDYVAIELAEAGEPEPTPLHLLNALNHAKEVLDEQDA